MPNVSFQISEDTKADLEHAITVAKFNGELPHDANQSDVFRRLVTDFIKQHPGPEDDDSENTSTRQ